MRYVALVSVFCARLVLFPSSAAAAPITLTFESFTDSVAVTNQFPDVTFSNTIAYVEGVGLNQLETPARSGTVAVSDDTGPISAAFSTPVFSVSGFLTYFQPVTIQAFDASSNLLAQAITLFAINTAGSGEPGSSPNEMFQLTSLTPIALVTITGDALGGSLVLDDFTFDTGVTQTAVPEPATVSLLAGGLALSALRRARARRRQGSID